MLIPRATYRLYTVDPPDSWSMTCPDRLPVPGDTYEFTRPNWTLANKTYNVGDRLEVIERTTEHHNFINSLGNLRCKCKHFTSVWSGIEELVRNGDLVLVQ